jgi:antitoxin component of RelBE/YafQ-DinJ toxin-antitoxin module
MRAPCVLTASCVRGTFIRVKTLEIHVPDEVATKVEAVASKHGVTIEQLLRLSLDEKLARDAELEEAVRDVLAENAELYRRLA